MTEIEIDLMGEELRMDNNGYIKGNRDDLIDEIVENMPNLK